MAQPNSHLSECKLCYGFPRGSAHFTLIQWVMALTSSRGWVVGLPDLSYAPQSCSWDNIKDIRMKKLHGYTRRVKGSQEDRTDCKGHAVSSLKCHVISWCVAPSSRICWMTVWVMKLAKQIIPPQSLSGKLRRWGGDGGGQMEDNALSKWAWPNKMCKTKQNDFLRHAFVLWKLHGEKKHKHSTEVGFCVTSTSCCSSEDWRWS